MFQKYKFNKIKLLLNISDNFKMQTVVNSLLLTTNNNKTSLINIINDDCILKLLNITSNRLTANKIIPKISTSTAIAPSHRYKKDWLNVFDISRILQMIIVIKITCREQDYIWRQIQTGGTCREYP